MRVTACLILAFILITFVLSQVNKNNYGPYFPHWQVFETCKGPKAEDCGHYVISDARNMSDVVFTFDFEKECPITTARVTISSLQANNKTKKLFNYALDKPCQHFVLGPILISSFNLNNHCKINKYRVTMLHHALPDTYCMESRTHTSTEQGIILKVFHMIIINPAPHGAYRSVVRYEREIKEFDIPAVANAHFTRLDPSKFKSWGHYDIHVNMLEKAVTFLGPNFFYGTYEFKVMAHNKVNNFFCVKSVINVDKVIKTT